MMPIFLLSDQETMSRDMPPTTTLALTLFLSSFFAGFYIYDLLKRSKTTEGRIAELEHVVHETTMIQESQSDLLHDHEERIREKKDYDECEEIEEDTYQAWIGSFKESTFSGFVKIWREKCSTGKKNQEWKNWNGEKDGSCIVRDFYLGNAHPDFSWTIEDVSGDVSKASVSETLINGWDSVVRIEINVLSSKEKVMDFVQVSTFEKSLTMNLFLKRAIDQGDIQWTRSLVNA
jgi:hypothetical protein